MKKLLMVLIILMVATIGWIPAYADMMQSINFNHIQLNRAYYNEIGYNNYLPLNSFSFVASGEREGNRIKISDSIVLPSDKTDYFFAITYVNDRVLGRQYLQAGPGMRFPVLQVAGVIKDEISLAITIRSARLIPVLINEFCADVILAKLNYRLSYQPIVNELQTDVKLEIGLPGNMAVGYKTYNLRADNQTYNNGCGYLKLDF